MTLTPDKVRYEQGLKICEKIIPWGATWTKNFGAYRKGSKFKADKKLSKGTGKVGGVTIHNTDGSADAATYTVATYPNQNMQTVRVHYYVDDNGAWQNLREDEVGWHAGDGSGNGNETTIAIEIIMHGKAISDDSKSEKNGALLAAILLNRYGLGIDKLYTHNHWMGQPDKIVNGVYKNCPIYILPHWEHFKSEVQANLDKLQGHDVKPDSKPNDVVGDIGYYKVQVGAFHDKKNADALLLEMEGKGYTPIIVDETSKDLPEFEIKDGSKIKIKTSAKQYSTGQSIPLWVKLKTYTVAKRVGNNILLHEIRSWINVNDVTLV